MRQTKLTVFTAGDASLDVPLSSLSPHSLGRCQIVILDDRYWKILGQFSEHGFNIERYDKIKDFRQNVALVPMSAKEGEGLQDLLAVGVGLAERFLEDRLTDTIGPAMGTVLEMRDEVGMGKTIDVILYRGNLKVGDNIMLASSDGSIYHPHQGIKAAKRHV